MTTSTSTTIMALMNSKPKIGFSIDSIVGSHQSESHANSTLNSPDSLCHYERCQYKAQYKSQQSQRKSFETNRFKSNKRIDSNDLMSKPKFHQQSDGRIFNTKLNEPDENRRSSTPNNVSNNSNGSRHYPSSEKQNSGNESRTTSPSSDRQIGHAPIVVPVPAIPANLMRPYPKQLPSYMNTEMVSSHASPHFLAAQFQMAATLAQCNPNYASATLHSHVVHPNMSRDGYSVYPWFLSRHGRIFPHRFAGSLLFQPFRKPKRVRTAFSPSQLLKLEHAFENNHYVVGTERKTLAQNLSLSETQVKVWFQNRRTKHKRMQQEDDDKGGNNDRNCDDGGTSSFSIGLSDNSHNLDGSHIGYNEDDELIDMEMDEEDDDEYGMIF